MADENNEVLYNGEPGIPLGMLHIEADSCDGATTTTSKNDPDYDPYIPKSPHDLSLPRTSLSEPEQIR
ncbi:hypothetical protein A2U01_0051069 [Trifolium medium]|uniref:Uncharacterized protein n=1 Tax=Trifolium medium TaxID=97028 RepID=A0A392R200_9FABA|nr:hypothetical protein [Trifolium medium]